MAATIMTFRLAGPASVPKKTAIKAHPAASAPRQINRDTCPSYGGRSAPHACSYRECGNRVDVGRSGRHRCGHPTSPTTPARPPGGKFAFWPVLVPAGDYSGGGGAVRLCCWRSVVHSMVRGGLVSHSSQHLLLPRYRQRSPEFLRMAPQPGGRPVRWRR
jgi:hypothetical protein